VSGKLVAGDVVTVIAQGEVGGSASFDVAGGPSGQPMAEKSPGSYQGTFTVPAGARGEKVPLTVRLADEAGNEATLAASGILTFDTRIRLAATARNKQLPADRQSQTDIIVKATNANGDPIQGHELALTLSTTEEYTGVVGGGALEGKTAGQDDEDDLEIKWGGKTDAFGEVKASYKAGFAAKTALLVAKDLTGGDVGVGWLNTYVSATVAITLTPAGARKGTADKARFLMTAEPQKLTADGRSTSRVKAWLTDNVTGNPLVGARVAFALAGENGRLKVLKGTTDAKGLAEAEYRAGTAIGTVTVIASAQDYGVTGSIQIVLMSDAPAKVLLTASALTVPADGRSTSKLTVQVTDTHDNPNQEVPVQFSLLQGAGLGSFLPPVLLTDRNGRGSADFRAGTTAGLAVVEARHTSRVPTEEELRRIYGTVFVPRWDERQERDRITLTEWVVKPGDKVKKGDVLVRLETRLGTRVLAAPADGVFVRRVKHDRDRVELGDTLGYVEIDAEAWKAYETR
jgi:hypothetical protein